MTGQPMIGSEGGRSSGRLHPLPSLFEGILAKTGLEATANNMFALMNRVARMTVGGRALSYFDQAGDAKARADFLSRFGDDIPEDRVLELCDDMIDWPWGWDPKCHEGLAPSFLKSKNY